MPFSNAFTYAGTKSLRERTNRPLPFSSKGAESPFRRKFKMRIAAILPHVGPVATLRVERSTSDQPVRTQKVSARAPTLARVARALPRIPVAAHWGEIIVSAVAVKTEKELSDTQRS